MAKDGGNSGRDNVIICQVVFEARPFEKIQPLFSNVYLVKEVQNFCAVLKIASLLSKKKVWLQTLARAHFAQKRSNEAQISALNGIPCHLKALWGLFFNQSENNTIFRADHYISTPVWSDFFLSRHLS